MLVDYSNNMVTPVEFEIEETEENTMKVRPLHNYLIIEKDDPNKVSSGGILLIRDDNDAARQGTVLAVGPGVYDEDGKHRPVGVEVGDRIAFDRTRVKDFEVDGEVYTFLMGQGVYGVIPKKD